MVVRYNQNFGYSRSVADKKRRRFMLYTVLGVLGGLVVLAGVGYWVIFSNFFTIQEIKAEGIEKINREEFFKKLDEYKKKKVLGFLNVEHNLLFFDKRKVMADIIAAFPIFEEVSINKNFPGSIIISVKERNAFGIWCFGIEPDQVCQYFDESGYAWGSALKSSGTLLVSVEDETAASNNPNINPGLIKTIASIYNDLSKTNIKLIKIVIPQNSIDELRAYTLDGYYLIFSTIRPIDEQTHALSIFLTQKEDRTFQYIDLRVKDRIYFK